MQAPRPLMPHPLNEERAQKGSASREGREGSYRPISGRRSNAPPAKGPLARPNQVHVPGAHRRQGAFKGHPGRRTSLCGASCLSCVCGSPPKVSWGPHLIVLALCLAAVLSLPRRLAKFLRHSLASLGAALPYSLVHHANFAGRGLAPGHTVCGWVVGGCSPGPSPTRYAHPNTSYALAEVSCWSLAFGLALGSFVSLPPHSPPPCPPHPPPTIDSCTHRGLPTHPPVVPWT